MFTRTHAIALFAGLLMAAPAIAADSEDCLGCHEREEFEGTEASEIAPAIKDPAVKAHGRFRKLSDEEIQAIARDLAS